MKRVQIQSKTATSAIYQNSTSGFFKSNIITFILGF